MQFKVVTLVVACAAAIEEWDLKQLLARFWPDRPDMVQRIAHAAIVATPDEELDKTPTWMPPEIFAVLKELKEADEAGRARLATIKDELRDRGVTTSDYIRRIGELTNKLAVAHPHPEETSPTFFAQLAWHLRNGLFTSACQDLLREHRSMTRLCMN